MNTAPDPPSPDTRPPHAHGVHVPIVRRIPHFRASSKPFRKSPPHNNLPTSFPPLISPLRAGRISPNMRGDHFPPVWYNPPMANRADTDLELTRPECAMPDCTSPAARRYDRPGKYRRWCDRHCRKTARSKTRRRGRPPTVQPPDPLAPDARACPVPGCRRLRELRGRRSDGTPHYRWTCQAHRGAIPNQTIPPPPPPKPQTPWKPQTEAHVHPIPVKVKKHRPTRAPALTNAPVPQPAATITTANDGTWQLTASDIRFICSQSGHPAFETCTSPKLSRPLPTSVVYRVWGMMERGELAVEEP